jgi:hypothetical protein
MTRFNGLLAWMGASALLVCVGSIGPWTTFLGTTLDGLDGDGWITLIAGLVALGLVVYLGGARRPPPAWPSVAIVLAAAIAAGTGGYHWWDSTRLADEAQVEELEDVLLDVEIAVSVDWGLVLVTLAGLSLALAATVALLQRADERDLPSTGAEA